MSYDPEAGDVVWLDFTPHAGHETAGRHPAIILTPRAYQVATGLALVVPVTTKAKGGSFEVPIRGAKRIKGVALANELRTIDYAARQAEKFDVCPAEALARIRDIGEALLRPESA
ncbi:type II toxin-antitoxin system PemK/MazF family toxin [Telmatospirillum siberiense]|uniref:mRNA-degrading endonuclease n=1 Tax=Telmatospirillum siberiense TaxID=382514 RepID=A0A2N3PMV6_9PROT|nr:type II toxin-antitoxin system PemK/MazF family toxin [Telmatospirillum siberiense]PKU21730.1 mRNA-degrading endonuclease [Telmatospirillum siberiense]